MNEPEIPPETMLLFAVQNRQYPLIKQILSENKVDLNPTEESFNITPLHYATILGEEEIVLLLLENGADPDIFLFADMDVQLSENIDETYYNGKNALHIAIELNEYFITDLLLDFGADPNLPTKENDLPLHIASNEINDSRMVSSLLDYGTNINVVDEYGRTALHHSILNGNEHLMEMLLLRGIDPNIPDKNGRTSLHLYMLLN